MNRMQTARRFMTRFGTAAGLLAYARLATAKRLHGSGDHLDLRIPVSARPVRVRAHTADIDVFWQVFVAGEYDIPVDFVPEVIVDAGAHVGYASLYFAHRFPQARIIAIEPAPANAELLRHNLNGNARVRIVESALWSSAATLMIANPGADSWSFRVRENAGTAPGVSTVTMPEILRQVGRIDILKLDVEGAELELLTGDLEWLRQVRMLIVELHERYAPGCTARLNEVMQRYGFEHVLEQGENVVFARQDAGVGALE
ncbi:MAG TPA: FkbM family methyltransferase [Steroidobacteraceae bacterium]|nr:FkbM family methyltransferase [Steroidobacteraceae bacterium]